MPSAKQVLRSRTQIQPQTNTAASSSWVVRNKGCDPTIKAHRRPLFPEAERNPDPKFDTSHPVKVSSEFRERMAGWRVNNKTFKWPCVHKQADVWTREANRKIKRAERTIPKKGSRNSKQYHLRVSNPKLIPMTPRTEHIKETCPRTNSQPRQSGLTWAVVVRVGCAARRTPQIAS